MDEILRSIAAALKARGLRLCLAESCTGGLMASMVTDLPGASEYFEASLVCYSNESKMRLLGISEALLCRSGAISAEAAAAMAEGAISQTGAGCAVAVTGNLGPDAMEDKPVGLVYVAVYLEGQGEVREHLFAGSRSSIKAQAAEAGLRFLHEVLCKTS